MLKCITGIYGNRHWIGNNRAAVTVVFKSFVPITNKDRSVMQGSRTGFQPVIPVGWASSPSIKWDRITSRVLRGTSPPNRFLFAIIFEGPYRSVITLSSLSGRFITRAFEFSIPVGISHSHQFFRTADILGHSVESGFGNSSELNEFLSRSPDRVNNVLHTFRIFLA